jgi:hypothetical protein
VTLFNNQFHAPSWWGCKVKRVRIVSSLSYVSLG